MIFLELTEAQRVILVELLEKAKRSACGRAGYLKSHTHQTRFCGAVNEAACVKVLLGKAKGAKQHEVRFTHYPEWTTIELNGERVVDSDGVSCGDIKNILGAPGVEWTSRYLESIDDE
jgi:hypothetical protein